MLKFGVIVSYLLIFMSIELSAEDIVRMTLRDPTNDGYQEKLIDSALQHSTEKYGPYSFIVNNFDVNSKRSFTELKQGDGELFNLRIALTSHSREQDAIPIRIPLTKGLQNYRLMIVNKGDADRFKHISNKDDLKEFTIGLLYDWMTTVIMSENKFDVIKSQTYPGMFRMLSAKRVDYTILGVNKVYGLMNSSPSKKAQFEIVPNLVLYINGPSYVFVSKKTPRIASRISWGFEQMIANGEFDKIFKTYHQPYIEKIDLASRKVIEITNNQLPDSVPIKRSELWLTF